MEHLSVSLIVALIGGIVDLDSTAVIQSMVSQPIVAAPLTGLVLGGMLGDYSAGLQLGLMVGVILQLVWIEQLPLGMNVPPDAALASVLSVALGFCAGHNYTSYAEREVCYTVGLLISVGLGLLGRSLDMFVRRLNTNIDSMVNQRIEDNNFGAIRFGHIIGGFITFTKAFLFCFLILWFGVEPLKYFTKMMNISQSGGFIVVQGLLPAVGFSVLASMCLKDKTEIKYLIGGILIFTIFPSKIWIAIIASFMVMLSYYSKTKKTKKGKK